MSEETERTYTKEEIDHALFLKDEELTAALQAARVELRFLECPKCETAFEAELGKTYDAGVFCPECRRRGYTMVGVCHLTVEKKRVTQHDWDRLVELVHDMGAALKSHDQMEEFSPTSVDGMPETYPVVAIPAAAKRYDEAIKEGLIAPPPFRPSDRTDAEVEQDYGFGKGGA